MIYEDYYSFKLDVLREEELFPLKYSLYFNCNLLLLLHLKGVVYFFLSLTCGVAEEIYIDVCTSKNQDCFFEL